MKRSILVVCILLVIGGIWLWRRGEKPPTSHSQVHTPVETAASSATTFASKEPEYESEKSFSRENSHSAVAVLAPGEGRVLDIARLKKRPILRRPSAENLVSSSLFPQSPWQQWRGVKAVDYDSHAQPLVRVSGYDVVSGEAASTEEQFYEGQSLVYFNTRTETAGVVTGVFRIILKDGADLNDLTMVYNLKITAAYPHLQTYFVTSKESPFSLLALQQQLKQEPAVVDSTAEILSRRYEKF